MPLINEILFVRNKVPILSIISIIFFVGCNFTSKKENKNINNLDINKEKNDDYKLGKKLKITGDFNGDGTIDTIYESYFNDSTHKEIYKPDNLKDEDSNSNKFFIKNKGASRLICSIRGVDTLDISLGNPTVGMLYLKNLGDIMGDGRDEVGYIVDWYDFSNSNTCHVIRLTEDKKWKELFSFPINEVLQLDTDDVLIQKNGNSRIKYEYFDPLSGDSPDIKIATVKLK